MKIKIYKLLSSTKQGLFALALTVFSGTAYTQITYTLNYTGAVQTLTLPIGVWGIQCWGANGGSITSVGGGGIGGYSKGEINNLTTGTQLNIYVGGRGTAASGLLGPNAGAGGWNGGGGGSMIGVSGAGGGGGTDVRVGGTSSTNRIIVAGGGGGAAGYYTATPNGQIAAGGNGGGVVAANGNTITSGAVITVGGGGQGANGATPGVTGVGGSSNGTATGGGGGAYSVNGASAGGQGTGGGAGGAAGGSGSGSTGCAGGGGGGYAGGAGGVQSNNGGAAGGGGSGYVGGVTNGTTVASGQPSFVTNPDLSGNGKVIITELCNITLLQNGVSGNTTICSGITLTLTTNAVSNYSWSTSATTSSIVVAPTTNTVYMLTAMSVSNCITSSQISVTVNNGVPSLTVANTASASSGICPNATVMLTASGATTYSWTGASTVTNGVAFGPTTTSGYTVTGTNACGTSTAALSLSIHPLPSVTGVVSQPTICSGNPITLTGVGNATNYIWNGNLANGVTQFPSITTTYTVVGWSALSCTASALASVTVVTTPLAPPIASPPLICIGSVATLSSSGASIYSWIGQSGPFSSVSSVTVAPTTSTTYTLTKSNANCVNTQTVRVIVNPLPGVFAFVNPTIVCEGKPANLSAGGASSYTWTAPPSFSVTGASPIVSPIVSTMYTVTASDGTCVNQTTVFLPTNPNPTVGIVATSSTICREQTVSLTASGALAYTWTAIGLTSNSTAVSITETPTLSTLYTVVGENTFNCTTGVNQVVVVYPNPTLTISSNKPMVCVGAPANLTVTGANTYTWDSNAGGATTPVVIVNPQVTTIYTVAGTYSATGCTTVKTIPIIVFQPTFAVNSPTSSCLGGTINLIASGAQSYTWNGTSPFSQISVSPPTATVYQVAATSVSVGVTCISTNSVQVSIYANPTVIAVPQRTLICKGEITNLVGTGAFDYQWSTGQTGSLVPVNPISNTTYTILGTDQNGCIGTASLALKVSPCFGINETDHSPAFVFVYPNPSTGAFTVKTETDVFLQLFNELGQIVRTFSLTATNGREIVVEELPNGIYLLSGGNSTSTVNQKILISK